ncbi:hypothetical protein D3C86_2263040 [compost metagenome]
MDPRLREDEGSALGLADADPGKGDAGPLPKGEGTDATYFTQRLPSVTTPKNSGWRA